MGPWGLDSQVVLSYSTATRQVDNATRQQLHAAAVVEAESLGGSAAGQRDRPMVLCTRRSMKGISMKSYDSLTSFKSRTESAICKFGSVT